MSKWPKYVSDWKIEHEDGSFHIKVIKFPVPKGSRVSGESMWVKVEAGQGDDVSGVGVLDNDPLFCTAAKCGDTVAYGDGSATDKPRYLKTESRAAANKPN